VDTKIVITQVPPHTDPKEHILEYFHNNSHGKKIKEFIEAKIGKLNATEVLEEAKEEVEKPESKKKKQ
jgi:hypothetical protein